MTDLANSSNHFLASLSAHDSDLLRPHLRRDELVLRSVLHCAEQQIARVYFPTAGIISLVVALSDGQMIEAGMFGRNGVVGGGAALNGKMAINQAIVQVAGSSLTIDAELLKRFAGESDALRTSLMRHELMSSAHTQQIAACNAAHDLEERMCRWLLQTRDLLMSDTLPLTQEFLAVMLGVQRSSVTMVARKLQESGLIKYRRGHIQLLDAENLQDACCECYETINGHFERLVGWRPDVPFPQ
jgi:CRP-like cAMP-binding protein